MNLITHFHRSKYVIFAFSLWCVHAPGCYLDELDERSTIETSARPSELHNGIKMNGLGDNGTAFNNLNLNGIRVNGVELNGRSLNGVSINGTTWNGRSLNGRSLNGVELNGRSLNGVELNGRSLNGRSLNGHSLGDIRLDGEPVDASSESDMLKMFEYLAHCALDASDSMTVTDLSGNPVAFDGSHGIDPSWKDHEPDLTRSRDIADCLIDTATAAGDHAVHHKIEISAFEDVLTYLVQCALDGGDSATIYDENGAPMTFHGALGLAPGWRDAAPTDEEQRKVSACLAARSNSLAQTVMISLRGAGISTDAVERAHFQHHEGAFWGNVFDGANSYINTCMVTGGGVSGRTCTEGSDCGFVSRGDCAAICDTQDATDRAVSDCDGETAVINTFLNLGRGFSFSDFHNCVIRDDDTLWCWGKNNNGQLGAGFASAAVQRDPLPVPLRDVVEVVGGKQHTCARTSGGEAYCWGRNGFGQVGDGTTTDRLDPTAVASVNPDVARISANRKHTCAVKTDGSLHCWGYNGYGELADGTTTNRPSPTHVSALGSQVASAALGSRSRSSCAIEVDGSLWCWGLNHHGQVGDGTTTTRTSPIEILQDASGEAFDGVTDVCGGKAHTCARRSSGEVYCWGQDSKYQIGDDAAPSGDRTRPVQVAFPGAAAPGGLSCGDNHTCAIRDNGELYCWGKNDSGEVGDGTTTAALKPTRVKVLDNQVATVTLARNYSCAVTLDSKLYCWGQDVDDVLFPGASSALPVEVILPVASLRSAADAYGSEDHPTTNPGSWGVARSASGANRRKTWYVKFDLGDVAVSGASKAVLLVRSLTSASCTLSEVEDDTWTESTLTWNNRPAITSGIGTLTGAVDEWVSLEVTGFVNHQLAGDRVVTFACEGENGTFKIATRDHADSNLAPVLQVYP